MTVRDIAIEAAAIAMGRTTEPSTRGLGMRARRELAAIAFDAAARAIATDLRAEGDRLEEAAKQTKSVPGFAHALSFGDAARHVLTTTSAADSGETADSGVPR